MRDAAIVSLRRHAPQHLRRRSDKANYSHNDKRQYAAEHPSPFIAYLAIQRSHIYMFPTIIHIPLCFRFHKDTTFRVSAQSRHRQTY